MPSGPRKEPKIVDFSEIAPESCPCGWARRGYLDSELFPGSLHVTEIAGRAMRHYHQQLTEIYYVLEAEPGALLEVDGRRIPAKPGISVLIPPHVRHSAAGTMKLLIVVWPKFDADDEWFD